MWLVESVLVFIIPSICFSLFVDAIWLADSVLLIIGCTYLSVLVWMSVYKSVCTCKSVCMYVSLLHQSVVENPSDLFTKLVSFMG